VIFCPLVAELLDPSMRPRHWTALVNLCRALERCDSGGGKGAKVETCWTLIYFYYVIWDDLGWFGLIFFGEQDMSIDLGRFFWAGMVIICNNEATSCMWNGMTRCSRMGLAMSCSICQTYSNLPMDPSGANACSWNEESPWTLRRSENCCSVICGHSSCTSTRRHTTACSQDGCYSISKRIIPWKPLVVSPRTKDGFRVWL